MIRGAKGVAIHDRSFWSSHLPLLDGLPRVIRDYQEIIGDPMPMTLTPETGKELHDGTLEAFAVQIRGEATSPTSAVERTADELAQVLVRHLAARSHNGEPLINAGLSGCGVVAGGSIDLLWAPEVVELKLTSKEPALRDVRQVLVYSGLLHLEAQPGPSVGLIVNPRLGVSVQFEIEELLLMTGGLTLDEFASRLGQFLVGAAQSN